MRRSLTKAPPSNGGLYPQKRTVKKSSVGCKWLRPYAWRCRQGKESKGHWLVNCIIDCQQRCKQTYGCRRVCRWIQRQHGRNVNVKAVLRVMRKLDLLSQIRRHRPYVHYKKAVHKYPNLLQRAFEQPLPNRFWVTDITYIHTEKGMIYMCAVVDLCGKMVLAYRIGNDMTSSLVTDTIRDAIQKEKVADGLTLHSDQGSQYTSQAYFDLSQEYHLRQINDISVIQGDFYALYKRFRLLQHLMRQLGVDIIEDETINSISDFYGKEPV